MIDVWYNDIIAKSNRVRELLKPSKHSTNDTVVGARFSDALREKKTILLRITLMKKQSVKL